MLTITYAYLSPPQKRLIRDLVDFQLCSLENILNEDIGEDLTLYCIREGIDKNELMAAIREKHQLYMTIYEKPSMIFSLDEDDQAIIKTILVNLMPKRFTPIQKEVWKKFMITDNLVTYFNAN